jgi:hypothetical protein
MLLRCWTPCASIASQNELRIQVFSPPYALDTANKPAIVSIAGTSAADPPAKVAYGAEFDIVWAAAEGADAAAVKVTSVALVAPTAVTHGFNNNQRVVNLDVVSSDAASKTMTVRAPPSASHAPPQLYMLFVINGKTYGRAQWVRLDTTEALAALSV